jgi:hypothetical protein
MAIKNYTTEIDPSKSAGQISALLAKHAAGGLPTGLSFAIEVEGRRFFYQLPARAEGVLQRLIKDRVEPRYRNIEHARRVAWRIVHDWVAAQLALIEAGAADIGEVFLPYLMTGPGETVYSRFLAGGGMLALPSGRPEEP